MFALHFSGVQRKTVLDIILWPYLLLSFLLFGYILPVSVNFWVCALHKNWSFQKINFITRLNTIFFVDILLALMFFVHKLASKLPQNCSLQSIDMVDYILLISITTIFFSSIDRGVSSILHPCSISLTYLLHYNPFLLALYSCTLSRSYLVYFLRYFLNSINVSHIIAVISTCFTNLFCFIINHWFYKSCMR